jgi:hypothetical protein
MIRKIVAAIVALFIGIAPAYAGSSTVTVKDGTGASQIFDVITDAVSHFVSMIGLCDGTAAAQCAAVKAASTAPVATDPAAVVAVSPNTPGWAATGSALPAVVPVIGVSDGGTGCSGSACTIIPKGLSPGTSGSASTDVISMQGTGSTDTPVRVQGGSAGITGSYCMGVTSGTIAAGFGGGSAAPLVAWRYGGSALAVVKSVNITAIGTATAFAAGQGIFQLFAARSFSANDTGGNAATLTGNNGKVRTSFATTAISDFRISSTAALGTGTRTPDATPLVTATVSISTATFLSILPINTPFYSASLGNQPLQFANNEGFEVQATVPGTGTWFANATVCWDEVTGF